MSDDELTFRQWLILSLMAFKGEGVEYPVDQLTQDLAVASDWLSDAQSDRNLGMWTTAVLEGYLYLGVVDGKIAFRPSGKDLPEGV